MRALEFPIIIKTSETVPIVDAAADFLKFPFDIKNNVVALNAPYIAKFKELFEAKIPVVGNVYIDLSTTYVTDLQPVLGITRMECKGMGKYVYLVTVPEPAAIQGILEVSPKWNGGPQLGAYAWTEDIPSEK